ncbi:MAG: hypothetical protein HFJ26_09165 [Clostridia bacterium]|jgi:hypothetical protein|nr:hypothetical protein [Clostridia bacterium]
MEEKILKEIMKECNLEKGKEAYIKLLIKICEDNNAKLDKIKEFYA